MKTLTNGHRRSFSDDSLLPAVLYSAQAEQAVLGSMLARPDAVLDVVFERMTESEFFVPAHQEVFKAMKAMHNSMRAVDITTLHQYFVDKGIAERIGSPGILAELATGLATHLNLGAYLQIVEEKAMRRRLQEACASIVQGINDYDSADDLIVFAEKTLGRALNEKTKSTFKTTKEVADSIRESINLAIKNKGKLLGITTGFNQLDRITNGWNKGRLTLVAGRPGDGKSVLLENFTHAAAVAGHYCGIFTMEMEAKEHGGRTIAHESGVSTVRQQNGQMDDDEIRKVSQELDTYEKIPIVYEDGSSMNIMALKSKARRMVKNDGVKLIGIDYLSLIESTQAKDTELERARECMRELKKLARELQIHIIVLAQINRKGAEESKNDEPQLHHIRNAGEDDPDTVILIHRKGERTPYQIERDLFPTRLKIAKNRGGPTSCHIDTILNAAINKFIPENPF